jgi:hypothetical protein
MTGFNGNQTPKTRPMSQKRTAMVASLDIGTSKIACMIARLRPCPPSDTLRGRSHVVELLGYSQIQSRGMKGGAVVDLAECEQWRRDRSRRQPGHFRRHAPCHRGGPHRAARLAGRLCAGRRQGHP